MGGIQRRTFQAVFQRKHVNHLWQRFTDLFLKPFFFGEAPFGPLKFVIPRRPLFAALGHPPPSLSSKKRGEKKKGAFKMRKVFLLHIPRNLC